MSKTWTGMLMVLATWVACAAYLTNIEYGDGYVTIANSHYLLGYIPEYFGARGSFLAFWLMPAR